MNCVVGNKIWWSGTEGRWWDVSVEDGRFGGRLKPKPSSLASNDSSNLLSSIATPTLESHAHLLSTPKLVLVTFLARERMATTSTRQTSRSRAQGGSSHEALVRSNAVAPGWFSEFQTSGISRRTSQTQWPSPQVCVARPRAVRLVRVEGVTTGDQEVGKGDGAEEGEAEMKARSLVGRWEF